MQYEELLMRLSRLDEDASLMFDEDKRFRMVIVGGSGLILLETITRATMDIDALGVSKELAGLLERYDINCRVGTFINNFPYNYEDRLHKVKLKGKKIDFYTASLEDIVIAKLFSNRDTDRRDITDPAVLRALDWEKLEEIVSDEEEIKNNALNERNYLDFLVNYSEYKRRFCP